MVDFFSFDPSFTSWTPSIEEFQSFTVNNKYYKAKANLSSPATTDSLEEPRTVLPPAPVHSYALKMTKHLSVENQQSSVSITMEETRTEIERDESKCPICAVEHKERLFLLTYQKLKENSKTVRNMCMRKTHPGTCHICTKHRPFDPSEGIPKCASDELRLDLERRALFAQQLPLPTVNYNRGPINLIGQPISVPGYHYHRGPIDLTGRPISVPGINCPLTRADLTWQPNPIHSMNAEPKRVNRNGQSVPGINSEPKSSVPKRTFEPETQTDSVSGYQFGLSYSVREVNKPKPFEPVDQALDWFRYYQQPNAYSVRMAYTKALDKLNEKSDNFPSKRMAAKFDIDNAKSDNEKQ